MSTNKAILTLHDITKHFTQGNVSVEVLRGITTNFLQDCTYALMGASGAGKSTLLHLIAGLDSPSSGTIFFDSRNIAQFSRNEHAHFLNKNIGLVFQLPYLIDQLSVIENVMLKGLISGIHTDQAYEKAYTLLHHVGLQEKAHHNPSTLSGGQQQRIAVLRALFNEPAFLLADEPTGNLDQATGKALIDFLLDCHAQWHMGIIISSHDAYVASRMQSLLHIHNGLLTD